MSNEDSKTRLLNILKWLESYQGSKLQQDSPPLIIDLPNPSTPKELSCEDSSNPKQFGNNPMEKGQCRNSFPVVLNNCLDMSISPSSTPVNGNCDERKSDSGIFEDSSICEIDCSSANSTCSDSNQVNVKQGVEVSDVQTSNTSACSESISENISVNDYALQENVTEISENLATGKNCSNKEENKDNIIIFNAECKTPDNPSCSSDDQHEVISTSELVVTDENTTEINSIISLEDSDASKTSVKQSLDNVVTEVDSDKIPTEDLYHSENSSVNFDCPLPGIKDAPTCLQIESTSNSTGLIQPITTKDDEINQCGSPQMINNQSESLIVLEHKEIGSNLYQNNTAQTVLNSNNDSIQCVGKVLNPDINYVRDSSSSSVHRHATSDIIEKTQNIARKNPLQNISSKEHHCSFSSFVNNINQKTSADQTGIQESEEVLIKRQGKKLSKARPNYTNLEDPIKGFKTSPIMTIKSNFSKPACVVTEQYTTTSSVPYYSSVYDNSHFKDSFVNLRQYSDKTKCRQVPEQSLYYANISMNRSSNEQYVIYPNLVNSGYSSICYSPQFQSGPVKSYISKTNDDVAMPSNIFSNQLRPNTNPFTSPYMCLQVTHGNKLVSKEKTNINGLHDFLEICHPLQSSNIPEMSNQNHYTVLQNAVLTPAQRGQQFGPNVYKGNDQAGYMIYENNSLIPNPNNYMNRFNQFISAQDHNSQIDNPIVKPSSNPYNPDIYQSKHSSNVQPIQIPPPSNNDTRNTSYIISNVRTDNGISPKQYLTESSFQPRLEPTSQHNSTNERSNSNIYLQQNQVRNHAENDVCNKTSRFSKSSLKEKKINRKNQSSLNPNNYIQVGSTANNMHRSFKPANNSEKSLTQSHYNTENIHEDNFKSIIPWFPIPTSNDSCGLLNVDKDMGGSAKLCHLVQQQEIRSSLSAPTSEPKDNGNVSENGQFLQKQLYNITQPLLNQNIGFQHNEQNNMVMTTKSITNDNIQRPNLSAFTTGSLPSVSSQASQGNCFLSEYPSVPREQTGKDFQNINDPSIAQQISKYKRCGAENPLKDLNDSNFIFSDNDVLEPGLVDDKHLLTPDGSKGDQSADMMADESFLLSDYDPVFLASLLTNDLDYYHDYNSAFDESFEDAASITSANNVQKENDYIEKLVSNFGNTTQTPDRFMTHHSANNQHINMSPNPTPSNTSFYATSVSTNDGYKSAFQYDNQMKYSKNQSEGICSSLKHPVCTHVYPTTQSGIMSQRYPSERATYQCSPGQTLYATDMISRIDSNPHTPKRRSKSAGSINGSSALVSEQKKISFYDPEVTKRFSDRCTSKTAYQLAESISDFEINKGKYVKKPGLQKENSFKYDNGSESNNDGRPLMSLLIDNWDSNSRNLYDVGKCSSKKQLVNIGLANTTVSSSTGKTKDVKQLFRRPRGRPRKTPRLDEETKGETSMNTALQAKQTSKSRIKKNANMDGKDESIQQVCDSLNEVVTTPETEIKINPKRDENEKSVQAACSQTVIETILNHSNDSQKHMSEMNGDEGSRIHSDVPSSSDCNAQLDDDNKNVTNIYVSEAPSQLTNKKELGENSEDANGWCDECSNLSQEERQMKSYLELKKKLDKRQKTNNASWKCPYLLFKSTKDKSQQKSSIRKCLSNYSGSPNMWPSSRNGVSINKPTVTHEDGKHSLNDSCNVTEDSLKLVLSSAELSNVTCVSEQTKPEHTSKTVTKLVEERHPRSVQIFRRETVIFDKQSRSNISKKKSSSPIAMIRPCIPLPIYPPPPPPLFKLPPPPPLREKKVTPGNVNPTIMENARLCFEDIKSQLSKTESDFDNFLISYANIVQGLQNCSAERYRSIKEILLKTSEIKTDASSSGNKDVEHQSAATATDISENATETKNVSNENSTEKTVLTDIDALSIQRDRPTGEDPLDGNEFTKDYTELVKIILTSRADEYRNIKLVISRNICGGADMKQMASKSTNQVDIEAKKAKLAAYFETVGKMAMMEEEHFTKTPNKSGRAGRSQQRKIVHDKKVYDMSCNTSLAGKPKKKSVGRPRKYNIKGTNVVRKPRSKKEERKCNIENADNLATLSSTSDDGFVEESTGDYIMGLGTESDEDIFFNFVSVHTNASENSKYLLGGDKSDSNVAENHSNSLFTSNGGKRVTHVSLEHTSPDGTEESGYDIAKVSPVKSNTRSSCRKSSRLPLVSEKRGCYYGVCSVDLDHNRIFTKSEPPVEKCISSFKKRNQSKIIKPKRAIILRRANQQKKDEEENQKAYIQSKMSVTTKKIYDNQVKDIHRTNKSGNSTKLTINAETPEERKTLKRTFPTEPCTDEDVNLMFIDRDIEMSEILDSEDSSKARRKISKLKENKYFRGRNRSSASGSIITKVYSNSLRSRSMLPESDFKNKSSKCCFSKEKVLKMETSFKNYISKININLNNDNDNNSCFDWMVRSVLLSSPKETSPDINDNKRLREKYNRHARNKADKPDLFGQVQMITAESNDHSENYTNIMGSLDKSNERKHTSNVNSFKKSKSQPHSRRNYNLTFQQENTKEGNVLKLINTTEVLDISKLKKVIAFNELTTDDSRFQDGKNESVYQEQLITDNGAKHCRLSSELTTVVNKKRKSSKGGEILKIKSINFEEDPILLKTTKLLKEEENFNIIDGNNNIFDILFQTTTVQENEIESENGSGTSNINYRDATFPQHSKSNANLLKIWDSTSSKLPVIRKHMKTNRLNTGDSRKTLVVDCCRLQNNVSNFQSLQSTEYTEDTLNSDTKTSLNGMLKNTNVSPKQKRRINRNVRFSMNNDAEETSSRKDLQMKMHLTGSNYKKRHRKTRSTVKTSKSEELYKKHLNLGEDCIHDDCAISKLESTAETTVVSRNLDSYKNITKNVGDIVSHVEHIISQRGSKGSKSTKNVNRGKSKITSRKRKKRPPLRCEYCSKQFKKPSQLLYHTRGHTGERPFKCDVCEKGFVSSTHLLRHSYTHTAVKPHVCATCGRAFSQRKNLMAHERAHTVVETLKCQKCSVTFRTRSNLVAHKKIHEQDQTAASNKTRRK